MTRADKAKELFIEGYNCSQAVAAAFCDLIGMDEKTANNIFQSMFKGETTIYETIEKLKEFKESPEQKEREIYACMIHCLLDEYRFYHQYPEKQLMTVSQFFGQIIKNRLIDGVIETIALKYILLKELLQWRFQTRIRPRKPPFPFP